MAAKDIFDKIQKEEILESCPSGDKSNCWFLVKNTDNTNGSDSKRTYYDDCGIWDTNKGRCHKQPYLLSENFSTIFLKNGTYCNRQRIKGKAVFIPIEPTPTPAEIVTMHRYETTLKSNPDFKKHVSWFTSATDANLQTTAMYEYQGEYKIPASDKIRTKPEVIKQLKTDTRKPKEVYLDMNLNNSMDAPKDTRQIKNAKSREKKKTMQPTNNIADEILEVLNMMNDHPFVQQVIHKKGQVPSIICHTDEQIVDLRLFLSRNGGTIGVDRTFNLGHFFVMSLVYKSHRVLKKETKDHPIFIGPLLLHKDASYRTYFSFFTYIATELKIDNIELRLPTDLSFGSDDEKALTKSIEDAFPSASRRLCSKHLKDNFNRYMQDKVGIQTKERQRLMDVVFGPEGLVNAETSMIFEERSVKITDEMKDQTQLCNYYQKLMKPRIQSFVTEPRRINKEFGDNLWTNNNSESVNHIFKRAVDWKPQTTPELVKKLYDCVRIQFVHLRGCLHGHGDYQLAPSHKHCYIPDPVWRCKEQNDKDNVYDNFLHDKRRKRPTGATTSTDGTYSVNSKAKSMAKKPCRRKRSTTERARSQR